MKQLSPASLTVTPTECRMIIFINEARPEVSISATVFPTTSKTVTQVWREQAGVTEEAVSWPNQTRAMTTPAKADNTLASPPLFPLTLLPLCRERLPGKSIISVMINCSIWLLWILKHYWKRYLNMHFQQMSEVLKCDFTTSSPTNFPHRNASFFFFF